MGWSKNGLVKKWGRLLDAWLWRPGGKGATVSSVDNHACQKGDFVCIGRQVGSSVVPGVFDQPIFFPDRRLSHAGVVARLGFVAAGLRVENQTMANPMTVVVVSTINQDAGRCIWFSNPAPRNSIRS